MLSALCAAALIAACSAESVNPQPLPPEEGDGTGSENGGKGTTGVDDPNESPAASSSDAGSSGDSGDDSGEGGDAGAADAASDGDHG